MAFGGGDPERAPGGNGTRVRTAPVVDTDACAAGREISCDGWGFPQDLPLPDGLDVQEVREDGDERWSLVGTVAEDTGGTALAALEEILGADTRVPQVVVTRG